MKLRPSVIGELASEGSRKAVNPLLLAAFLYLAILSILFLPLFAGHALSAATAANSFLPWAQSTVRQSDIYQNETAVDTWTQCAVWEHLQYQFGSGGEWPFWTRRIYCGFPVHANGQSAFLYPFHVPYFFGDPESLRGPVAILRLWVSALALFLLLRRYSLSWPGAFTGGLIWMLASFNIRWLLWRHTNVTLWLPVLLLALDFFLARPSWRRLALAGLAATVLQLGGHPGTQWMAGVVAGLYVLVRVVVSRRGSADFRGALVDLLGCGSAMLLGVLGAAATLFPFLLNMIDSAEWLQHQRGLISTPLPLSSLILMLSPDFFGNSLLQNTYCGPANYQEICLWFGFGGLVLAGSCLFARAWRGVLPAVQCGAGGHSAGSSAAGASGSATAGPGIGKENVFGTSTIGVMAAVPAYFGLLCGGIALLLIYGIAYVPAVAKLLPFYGTIIYGRCGWAIHLGGAILAAYGIDALFSGTRSHRRSRLTAALVACVLFLVLLVAAGWRPAPSAGELQANISPLSVLCRLPAARVWAGVGMALLLTLVLAANCLRSSADRLRGWLQGSLIACLAVDLLLQAWALNPMPPIALLWPPAPAPLMRQLAVPEGSRMVAVGRCIYPNLAIRYGFSDLRGYDLPHDVRWQAVTRAAGFLDGDITTLAAIQVRDSATSAATFSFLRKCAVRFIVLAGEYAYLPNVLDTPPGQVRDSGTSWRLTAQTRVGLGVYENTAAYPRAFLAGRWVRVHPEMAGATMLDPECDLRQYSVIDCPSDADFPKPNAGTAQGTVTLVDDRENSVALRVVSPSGGLVVLHDRMAKGWLVDVDGRPSTAWRTNYLFRGVFVPAGTHLVTWRYQAPGFRAGVGVSLLSCAFMLICVAAGRRPEPPTERPRL